jgi:hypothetical protein
MVEVVERHRSLPRARVGKGKDEWANSEVEVRCTVAAIGRETGRPEELRPGIAYKQLVVEFHRNDT